MKYLILTLLFVSCSRIGIKTPASRFITPEANGKLFHGKVTIESQASTSGFLNLSDDKIDNSMDLVIDTDDINILGLFEFGLHEKIDFIVKGHQGAPPVQAIKYQFIGKPLTEAKKGDQSFAMTLGAGTESRGDKDNTTVNGEVDADIYHRVFDIGLIAGKRVEDDTLVYLSLNYSKHEAEFELESSDRPNLNGEKFELKSDVYGINLGTAKYYKYFFMMTEFSIQHTNWTHNDPTTMGLVAGAVGWKWK